MFALIPLVIAIILSGLVATSMIYGGGSIFTESKTSAVAQIFINEGAQIKKAVDTYHRVFEAYPASINVLLSASPRFLGSSPRYTYTIDANGRVRSQDADLVGPVCSIIQESAGQPKAPGASLSPSQLFGCFGSANPTFYFQ